MNQLNMTIIELAFIHKINYADGYGYHYTVSYLVDIDGIETVVEVYANDDTLPKLPMTEGFPIVTYSENGEVL